jgi:glycosyltransferase involved in cell wall biosynthesis
MRILFRHLDGGDGSASSMLKLLEAYCQCFPEDRLTVICPAESILRSLDKFGNCDIEPIPRRLPRELYRLYWGFAGVRSAVRRKALDAVWCVNLGAYVRTQVPQVLTMNNAYQVYPSETAALHPKSPLFVAALKFFFRVSLRKSTAVIAQTGLIAKHIRRIKGCPELIAVVPKGVVPEDGCEGQRLSDSIAAQLQEAAGATKLLYVATNAPHKNHRLLAGMMGIFRVTGRAVKLVVTLKLGEWNALVGAVGQSLVTSGHVLPIGWVSKDQLADLYRRCDVCVMPSLLESMSSASLEAMYWRIPQVAADLPYAHDLCGDAVLYADPHDAAAWARQVEAIISDSALRNALIANGTRRMSAFPKTWAEMAKRTRNILAEVAGQGAERGSAVG